MKLFKREKVTSFFNKHFSFDADIDLSNKAEVLYRKNIVIKNIIFLSNIVYSLLLFVVTFGSEDPGAWLFSVIPFPITFLLNRQIKKMIHHDPGELIRQQIAMYMATFYMFLSAIIIYIKLATGSDTSLATAGYMLLYYSLIVVSLYQDRKMLKTVFLWMLPIVTALHVFITHSLQNLDYASDWLSFLAEFFTTTEFRDIFFRTVVMGCFMVAVYAICVIGEKMSAARTLELSKRHEIQNDFTNVVTNLFDVLIRSSSNVKQDESRDLIFYKMTNRLSSLCGYNPTKCEELSDYSLFLTNHKEDFKIEITESEEDNFEILRSQSVLGTQLVKRIELAQKTETIVRAHVEQTANSNFSTTMNTIQKNDDYDIILLCDLYITLREHTSYKRPYSHRSAMEVIQTYFYLYFEQKLLERFIAHNSVFDELYESVE